MHEHVLARPRDQRRGLDEVSLCRLKRRWKCGNHGCQRKTFTESLTGVTNARSESLNRIAKLEARQAYSFRTPANQRRRVRMACTRGNRRAGRGA